MGSIASRFRDVEHLKHFVLATVLDPRYKLRCFSSPSKATAAREMLLEEYQSCTSSDAYPSSKRPRITDSFADSSLLHTVESIMAENLVDTESELEPGDSLILSYIKEPNLAVYTCHPDPIDSEKVIKKRNNPLEYWKQNEQSKPVLARLARTFLCI